MTGKKKINIILIIVVLGLWGTVAYKSVSHYFLSGKSAIGTINHNVDLNIHQINKDTFHLEGIIRDPFLNKNYGSQSVISETKRKHSKPLYTKPKALTPVTKIKQYVNWPSITYYGYIKSKEKGEEFFLVKINKKLHKIRINEEIEGVILMKVYKDSIKFNFNGEIKNIQKNKP